MPLPSGGRRITGILDDQVSTDCMWLSLITVNPEEQVTLGYMGLPNWGYFPLQEIVTPGLLEHT